MLKTFFLVAGSAFFALVLTLFLAALLGGGVGTVELALLFAVVVASIGAVSVLLRRANAKKDAR